MYRILLFLFLPFFLSSQNRYSIDSIPSKLKENVDAVIRLEKTEFIIKDKGNAIRNEKKIVTVMNDRGAEKYERFVAYYDKFNKIKDIEGAIYDAKGVRIYKVKKENIFDVSLYALSNDIGDARMKIMTFDKKRFKFPYTVEFSSSVLTKNMMFYPSESFYAQENTSTEEKTLQIESPIDFEFRIKERNLPFKATIINDDKRKIYNWTIKNISAQEYESYMPLNIYPEVITAPKEFTIEKYGGDIESWNDLGKFMWSLNEGRDVLPDNTKLKIKDLIKNERDTLKIIEILYNYLQNNTRYISIQLGIGGWQTITADEVANKGYGDCKALSNYMKAILKVAGISSYMALVNAGENEEDVEIDFPNARFNHVVNCVPLKNDTIWLECTSQRLAAGYLGSATGNRKALLILPEGGELVNTCRYTDADNTEIRKADIKVDELGNAKAIINTIYLGVRQESKSYIINEKNEDQQKKSINNSIPLSFFEVDKFSFEENKQKTPSIKEIINLTVFKLINKTGSLYLIKPNIMNKRIPLLPNGERKSPFFLDQNMFGFQEIDSLLFNISSNFIPELIPASVSIDSKFGQYKVMFDFKNGILSYYRKLNFKSGYFPAKDYQELLDFIKSINKNDQLQVVFKKV